MELDVQDGNFGKKTGKLCTGWAQIGNKKYYLGDDGVMVTGKQTIDGVVYEFDANGVLIQGAENNSTNKPGQNTTKPENNQPSQDNNQNKEDNTPNQDNTNGDVKNEDNSSKEDNSSQQENVEQMQSEIAN